MVRFLIRYLLITGLCGSAISDAWAQTEVDRIRVVDASSGQAVPYASIGVQNRPLGTVANAEGTFLVARIGAATTDTVIVSCVGYESRKLLAARLHQEPTLRLTPQSTKLAEVVVRSRQPRRVMLGHNWVSALTSYGFYTTKDTVAHVRLGREIGVLLNVKHPARLESFHLFTSGRDFQSVTFRLNIYAVQDGAPQQSLLRRDVIFTINGQRRGWNTVHLRPFAITLEGPQQVVATVEWLGSEAGRPGGKFLDIPAHLSAVHTMYSRDKSAQAWTRYGSNPSLYFDALSYPE